MLNLSSYSLSTVHVCRIPENRAMKYVFSHETDQAFSHDNDHKLKSHGIYTFLVTFCQQKRII